MASKRINDPQFRRIIRKSSHLIPLNLLNTVVQWRDSACFARKSASSLCISWFLYIYFWFLLYFIFYFIFFYLFLLEIFILLQNMLFILVEIRYFLGFILIFCDKNDIYFDFFLLFFYHIYVEVMILEPLRHLSFFCK